jgi:hypothetical protein
MRFQTAHYEYITQQNQRSKRASKKSNASLLNSREESMMQLSIDCKLPEFSGDRFWSVFWSYVDTSHLGTLWVPWYYDSVSLPLLVWWNWELVERLNWHGSWTYRADFELGANWPLKRARLRLALNSWRHEYRISSLLGAAAEAGRAMEERPGERAAKVMEGRSCAFKEIGRDWAEFAHQRYGIA